MNILYLAPPQVQTKIQNIHLKVTFQLSSPIAQLPARQEQVTGAPCVGSAVCTICTWGLQISQGAVASSLLLTHFMTLRFVSLPARGFCPTLKCGSKRLCNSQKLKQNNRTWRDCLQCHFPVFLPPLPGEGNTGQVTSHTSHGWWWHECPGGAARTPRHRVSLQTCPCSETQPLMTGRVQ